MNIGRTVKQNIRDSISNQINLMRKLVWDFTSHQLRLSIYLSTWHSIRNSIFDNISKSLFITTWL
jgi:hypothetical protein